MVYFIKIMLRGKKNFISVTKITDIKFKMLYLNYYYSNIFFKKGG